MYLKKNLKSILYVFSVVFSVVIISCAQDEGHKNHNNDMQKEAEVKIDSSIVREGVIDLSEIDMNNDGKVFQDPMDWNVISDKPGRCPLCKMNLEEVTIEIAKENLINNNFQIKSN